MTEYEHALSQTLQALLTPRRRERFAEVLRWRTGWVSVLLVDLFQQHNASAILRTCDAFGIQHVQTVEYEHEFETNPEIALGSDQWLTIDQFRGESAFTDSLQRLRQEGRRIVATVLHEQSRPIGELPLDRPVTLLFGTEKHGLPEEVVNAADDLVHLPMYGFVESFNVSVAAALCLQDLTRRLHVSSLPWQLGAEEQARLRLEWTRRSVTGVEAIERRFRMEWDSAQHK